MEIDYIKFHKKCWKKFIKCYDDVFHKKLTMLPPPVEVIRGKKDTKKFFDDIEDAKKLTIGCISSNWLIGDSGKCEIPSTYTLRIFDYVLSKYNRMAFNNEMPLHTAEVFMTHLLFHEYNHYVKLCELYGESILTGNATALDYHIIAEVSSIFDERRNEEKTMIMIRYLYDHDFSNNSLVPTAYGFKALYSKREDFAGIVMIRILELNNMVTYYKDKLSNYEYVECMSEQEELISMLRSYSLYYKDSVTFV